MSDVSVSKKEFPARKVELEAGTYSDSIGYDQPDPFESLVDAFGLHTWVYACANTIANAFSTIDFIAYVKNGDDWVVNEKHPFMRLLSHPNSSMSGVELKRIISLSSKLTGNAYIIVEPENVRSPLELWPLQPHKVTVKPDTQRLIGSYVYSVNGHKQEFSPDRIIHVREATPSSLHYGMGCVSPIKKSITSDLMAEEWNRYFFSNSGRPDAILQSDTPISLEARKKMAEEWKKTHGGSRKTGRIAILSGVKYVEVNRAHKDMDFVAMRKILREEVLSAFGVPQSMVGILDQANYSNMKEQTKVFWTQTMIPEIRKFESVMTLRAAQITGDDKTIIQADLSKVEALRQDEQARASVAQTYFNIGIPLDQIIEALDLPFDASMIEDEPKPDSTDNTDGMKGLKTKENLDAVWKKFDSALIPHEQNFTGAVRSYFRAQKKRVMDKFDESAGKIIPKDMKLSKADNQADYFFNFEKEKDLLGKVVDRNIRKAYYDFAVRAARGLMPGVSFAVDETNMGRWVSAKVLKLQQEVTAYTREQLSDAVVEGLRDAIASGLSQSETIDQIRERIVETYDFAVGTRAERIARTETIGAANAGSYSTIKDSPAEKKMWVTSRDSRVRDEHQEMDGVAITKNDKFKFSNGDYLDFPGDPEGDPGSIINCRCSIVGVFDE